MRHLFFVLSLALIVALAGCQVSTKPRTFARVSADHPAKVTPAGVHGEYRLYAAADSTAGFAQPTGDPLATHHLSRGEPVGFRRDASGQLQAIAGDASQPLANGSYFWQVRADKGQIDKQATTALVLTGAAVVLAVSMALIF
jgi:hypothetical protein